MSSRDGILLKAKPPTRPVRHGGPLSTEEARHAHQVAIRLTTELSYLLNQFGGNALSSRWLSRELDVDFSCCQQVVTALRVGGDDPGLFFHKLPGPQSLTNLAHAVARKLDQPRTNTPISQAINDFQKLIEEFGGSYANLRRRLAATPLDGGDAAAIEHSLQTRKGLQKFAAQLMGHNVDVLLNMLIVRPIPGSPELIETISVNALVGVESASGTLPLLFRNIPIRPEDTIKIRPLDTDSPNSLVRAFSTPELAGASFEQRGQLSRETLNLPLGAPCDVVMATHSMPHINQQHHKAHFGHIAYARRPTKRLLIDCYLHKDMAADQQTSVAAYTWHQGFRYDPLLDRDDQLPVSPRLEILGQGLERAATNAWHRHKALTAHLFELAGWNPGEFHGYRCDEPMPVWNSAYIMTFDYREHNADA